MSIHLAAAGLSRYLPWPVPAAEHVDCVTALHAAQRELLSLDAECGLALIVLTQVRARLATALTQAHSLPR
jgi:histidine ammonia-lyase